ncbi:PKD domain-containing protein [Nitrososphaera sp.]|uniref:PKD domain-containing protein n=1 Tax=Nitrososphaera sp. TaxID=1971748 RepID=UPI00307E04A0
MVALAVMMPADACLRAAAAIAFASALVISPGLAAAQAAFYATMEAWSPAAKPIAVGAEITFRATSSAAAGVQGFEWDFDGDGQPDASSPADKPGAKRAAGAIKHAYGKPFSGYPAARAVDVEGFVTPWDVYDSKGEPVLLVVGSSPAPPQIVMDRWSPYSAAGPDGLPSDTFRFSAAATAAGGIARVEWDFNGDGRADSTTSAAGSPKTFTATATHRYGAEGSWIPRARAIDSAGLASAWAGYVAADDGMERKGEEALDVAAPRLYAELGFEEQSKSAPGSFSFSVTLPEGSSSGALRFEWDFDGDGRMDATTNSPSATHRYARHGSYLPSVTVTDSQGSRLTVVAVDKESGQPLRAVFLPEPPTAAMGRWVPPPPQQQSGAGWSFSATLASRGGLAAAEWDFDGDGVVDARTPASGNSARVTASFAYKKPGDYVPQVRAVDSFGQASQWAASPGTLKVSGQLATGDLYCNGMTIEQLLSSGKYNVIDKRQGQKRTTVTGTAGDDLVLASDSGSVIRGVGGNDCIIGGAGNDIIWGGDGDDQLFGAGGSDRLDGGSGNDLVIGAAGADSLDCGPGKDRSDASAGEKTVGCEAHAQKDN